jgi:hypothetical protein
MAWSSSAQGNRPYAPSTRRTVGIVVTPIPENGIFCSLCFQSLTHSFLPRAKPRGARSVLFGSYILCSHILTNSFALVFSTTPLQSYSSALFAKNTGGGYTPPSLPLVFKGLRTPKVLAFPELACRSRVIRGGRSSRWCPRCRPVGAPLCNGGKRSLSRFSSYRCRHVCFTTRRGTPTPSIQRATP